MAKKDCDCLEKLSKLIIDKAKDTNKHMQDFTILESGFEHRSLYPKTRIYTNFIFNYTFKKKDGLISKPKNDKTRIFFTYCPFCGKKLAPMK